MRANKITHLSRQTLRGFDLPRERLELCDCLVVVLLFGLSEGLLVLLLYQTVVAEPLAIGTILYGREDAGEVETSVAAVAEDDGVFVVTLVARLAHEGGNVGRAGA